MISVGIDVAKGKSTVCILKPYGEIVSKPFDMPDMVLTTITFSVSSMEWKNI